MINLGQNNEDVIWRSIWVPMILIYEVAILILDTFFSAEKINKQVSKHIKK